MSYFITPKHSGTIDNFLYPLLALNHFSRDEWVSCEDFKNELFNLYVKNNIASEWRVVNGEKCMKKDSSDYTKDLQLPAYFGFVEADSFQRDSSKRITELGEKLLQEYEYAGKSFDCDAVKDIFLQAMNSISFGRGNYGVINSDSDLEAPAIYLKSAILLDGLSVKEFAYIIDQMENYNNDFSKVIIDVKRRRKQNLPLNSDISTDIKFVTLFKNFRILVDGPERNLNYVCDYYLNFKYDEVSALPIDNKEKDFKVIDVDSEIFFTMSNCLQKIYYGAPGTGKSNEIKLLTSKGKDGIKFSKDFTFRTTFHPDSDYSSFVGCYKPTQKERIVKFKSWEELKQIADNLPVDNGEKVKAIVSFIRENADSIKKVIEEKGYDKFSYIFGGSSQESDNQNGDRFCWNSNSYLGSFLEEILKERQDNYNGQLTYAFTPQAFTKAYVAAWTHPNDNVALVIEEINRGNCAQIFGDIFQLLDRESNGLSKYPIEADIDMQAYLNKQFANLNNIFDDELKAAINKYYEKHYYTAFKDIKCGKILTLPPNLSILCTMNTSDQSLFPMDSAFKRRWDWQYMPIKDGGLGWKIELDENHEAIDWWDFLKRINKVVADLTTSEDKQLGYFFCQPDSFIDIENKTDDDKHDLITAKHFVDKVIFYLWNDVFKDYAFDASCCKDENGKEVLFAQFYNEDGKSVNIDTLKHFFEPLQSNNEPSLIQEISTDNQDEPDVE